jgi:DNA-binding Lrp family transcriptional regulator
MVTGDGNGHDAAEIELTALERALLERFQRGLPLSPRPYAAMAGELGCSEAEVIAALERLQAAGAVSRVGGVVRPHAAGWSTLAALAVPPERLEAVAELVSAYPEVNHNYEREHRFNLWFVVTASDAAAVRAVLDDIAGRTGLTPLDLPLLEAFHLDLGFALA